MPGWFNDWLPEAGIGTGALVLVRLLSRSSPGVFARLKDWVFDLGALYIRYERSESDNRAKDETIAAQNRQTEEKDRTIAAQHREIVLWRDRAYSLGYRDGSTGASTASSATPPTSSPPTPK